MSISCEGGNTIKRPEELGAHALSDTQILLMWNKDLGLGYNYRITIKIGAVPIRISHGMMTFGSIAVVVVDNLLPNQRFDFEVRHECSSNPGTLSSPRTAFATTLTEGITF